jgi:putative hydrolase of the HAD superfamily
MTRIETIVFDIGRVLVDFSFDPFKAFLVRNGVAIADSAEFLARTQTIEYETGGISDEAFIENLVNLFPAGVDRVEVTNRWVRIFEPIPEMMAYAEALNARYPVYLGSNTSPLHWEYLRGECGLERVCRAALTSFQARACKPDAAFYRHAEVRFGLRPETTVFVDDLSANVEGARARGWHAIHHTSPAATKAALRAMGVT